MENDAFSASPYSKEYIYSLPQVCVTTNNDVSIWVRYDKEKKIGFHCDASGSFLGNVYTNFDLTPVDSAEETPADTPPVKKDVITDALPSPPPAETQNIDEAPPSPPILQEQIPHSSDHSEENTDPAPIENPTQSDTFSQGTVSQKKSIGFQAVTVSLLSLLILINLFNLFRHQRTTPVPDHNEATSSIAPSSTTEESDIHILTLNRNVYPGESITADALDISTVSVPEYRMLLSSGGAYLESDLPKLIEMKYQYFIASGTPPKYSDVVANYLPQNPWEPTYEGYGTITLPISENDTCTPGSVVKISVRTKRKTSAPSADDTPGTQPVGIEHNSSVVESTIIDTYDISSAIISDTFNSEKESLFIPYSIIADVPVLFRTEAISTLYDDPQKLSPTEIKLILPEDQAKLLSEIGNSIESVTITPIGADISDTAKQAAYTKMQQAAEAIGGV